MIGNGNNSQFTFLDLLGVMSFLLGIANYGENVSQSDIQDLMKVSLVSLDSVTKEIHSHLENQDIRLKEIETKMDYIINMLEDMKNDS